MNTNSTHIYHPPTDVDPYVKELIRHKIRRLVTSHGVSRTEGEDLAQELALHAVAVTPKYDPSRGARTTFFEMLLTRRLANLLVARRAQKRDRRREIWIEMVPEEELAYDPWPQFELVRDVREALASLPPELRQVADRLGVLKQAEVVRETGLTRQRVRGRQRRIAQHLRSRGLP